MPLVTPLTKPVVSPAFAIAVLLLIQVPPVVALLSVTIEPTHTSSGPVISLGRLFTVNTAQTTQPEDRE